jgi:hypothetical protein
MNRSFGDDAGVESRTVTGFDGGGCAARIARILVIDMILWPGLLFVAVTLALAWQARGHPVALAVLALATLASVLIGVRQWDVMLRAVLSRPAVGVLGSVSTLSNSGAGSPRPTGRGGTER